MLTNIVILKVAYNWILIDQLSLPYEHGEFYGRDG